MQDEKPPRVGLRRKVAALTATAVVALELLLVVLADAGPLAALAEALGKL